MVKAALAYAKRGWSVVPVEFRGKRPINLEDPRGRGWQHLRGDGSSLERWFSGQARNIGVILGEASGGLVDIDLDCAEALFLAPRFLPKTESIFGRASKPNSHWLFTSPTARTQQFKDPVSGQMILELRADGTQTVFPPSRHESDEEIEWGSLGDPSQILHDHLERDVSVLAAAALLARRWPAEGGRHDASLTLTAVLTRASWSNERTAHFVASVSAAAGGDADHAKRLATARDARERLGAGRTVRGYPALVELFGEAVASKVGLWLGLQSQAHPALSSDDQRLDHGSHVALAREVLRRLRGVHGDIVFAEGRFWWFDTGCWRPMPEGRMRAAVYDLDASPVQMRVRPISLTRTGIDGILYEMQMMSAAEDFFERHRSGVNCQNGLVSFDEAGAATLHAHSPDHRRRYVVRGSWSNQTAPGPAEGSLFHQFLEGSFGAGSEAQGLVDLLAEVAGVAALGVATDLTQPVAIILHGPSANNGKSQVLQLLRGLVSPDAAAALSPDLFADEKQLVALAGRTLNACDEIGGAAIFSEAFKRIITGEPISARDVYKSAFQFRPRAQHVFATNELPTFRRGIDHGVQRRVLIVPMVRSIPVAGRIPNIAARILAEEADLVLAWAIEGARRALNRGDLARPTVCLNAGASWLREGDMVLAWLLDDGEVVLESDAWTATNAAYKAFRIWANRGGFQRVPNVSVFSRRVCSSGLGVQKHRKSHAAGVSGLTLKRVAGARDA